MAALDASVLHSCKSSFDFEIAPRKLPNSDSCLSAAAVQTRFRYVQSVFSLGAFLLMALQALKILLVWCSTGWSAIKKVGGDSMVWRIGRNMRAHTRCLSVGVLALMGRFYALLHESSIVKTTGQLNLNQICSSYFHNIRLKYVLNLFDNPKSGAGSHVEERGTTQVFFFAAVRAEFDALLADDCTGEARPSMMSKCSFCIHTGPRHVFSIFFPAGYFWRSIWICCLFCWMKACPSQDSNFLNYHWIWFDQSKRSALTLWSQFCRLMNRYAPCRNSRICFAIFLHFARSAK